MEKATIQTHELEWGAVVEVWKALRREKDEHSRRSYCMVCVKDTVRGEDVPRRLSVGSCCEATPIRLRFLPTVALRISQALP